MSGPVREALIHEARGAREGTPAKGEVVLWRRSGPAKEGRLPEGASEEGFAEAG
ncbi:hypothetical protein GCM10018952_41780 [Streptosporangium vulgare]